jgi:hypothetical protein
MLVNVDCTTYKISPSIALRCSNFGLTSCNSQPHVALNSEDEKVSLHNNVYPLTMFLVVASKSWEITQSSAQQQQSCPPSLPLAHVMRTEDSGRSSFFQRELLHFGRSLQKYLFASLGFLRKHYCNGMGDMSKRRNDLGPIAEWSCSQTQILPLPSDCGCCVFEGRQFLNVGYTAKRGSRKLSRMHSCPSLLSVGSAFVHKTLEFVAS